jgi:hypothetical protein
MQYGLFYQSHLLLTDFYNQNSGGKTKKAGSLAILALKVL